MRLEDLGFIGNCQFSAHVDRRGAVVWCCLPRFDAPPIFGALLDEHGGLFSIAPAEGGLGTQRYLTNTNVLETVFETSDGRFRVLDFAPRFERHERSFRPTKLVRVVEPLSGSPRIRVSCQPVLGWSKRLAPREVGSNHVRFHGFDAELRLTTDMPLACIDGPPSALVGRRHFVLAWGAPVEEPLAELSERFLDATTRYWQSWVRRCQIPAEYQPEVIRSALALKLHCYEDTGAIVAGTTTSIPESAGSGRTWDYRYCWLRDAYYTLGAFRRLGQFEERDRFLEFLLNVAASSADLALGPVYRVDGSRDLPEHLLDDWAGYRGERPVRCGNGAASHEQHDVFGELVLALAPMFRDERFREHPATDAALDLLVRLARRAIAVAGTPDAGIWEYRARWRPQTFSTLMCWAGVDRAAAIVARRDAALADELARAAQDIRSRLLAEAVHPTRGCLVADHGGEEVDAALLQAIPLRLLPRDSPVLRRTIEAVREDLGVGGWLRRYRTRDDFGEPSVAFVLCTHWLVEALAAVGDRGEARAVFEATSSIRAPLGLLAEDVDPSTGEMWGNFPQAYSHVGLIHAAFAASASWSELEP